jgi:hypothetical protein
LPIDRTARDVRISQWADHAAKTRKPKFFRYQKFGDQVIALALQARWNGASLRGARVAIGASLGLAVSNNAIGNWYKLFGNLICSACVNGEAMGGSTFCRVFGIRTNPPPEACKHHTSRLVPDGAQTKYAEFIRSSREWLPYAGGHPGAKRIKNWDHPIVRNAYCRRYYTKNERWAKSLMTHPENYGQRLALRELTDEQREERIRLRTNLWYRRHADCDHAHGVCHPKAVPLPNLPGGPLPRVDARWSGRMETTVRTAS